MTHNNNAIEYRTLDMYTSSVGDEIRREAELRQMEKRLDQIELADKRMVPPARPNNSGGIPEPFRSSVAPSTQWRTRDGKPVYVLTREQHMRDLPASRGQDGQGDLSVGRLLRALVTNNPRYAPTEMRALGEGTNTGGGFLVPESIHRQIIDLARAKSVMIAAGMQTVNMETETLRLVKVLSDPTMSIVGENEEFPESEATFGSHLLTSRKYGCRVLMSRELAEDSGNAEQMLEAQLAAALAVHIDSLALTGGAADGMTGLENFAGVGTTTSHGSAATAFYDKLIDAVIAVESANGAATSIIAAPLTWGYFTKLKSGDGDTSALTYLSMPEKIASLQRLATTSASTGYAYVGDFTQCLLGVRNDIEVAVDRSGERFDRDQVCLRVRWRGDFTVVRPTHFNVIDGITA